jgi:hypothetical protein
MDVFIEDPFFMLFFSFPAGAVPDLKGFEGLRLNLARH